MRNDLDEPFPLSSVQGHRKSSHAVATDRSLGRYLETDLGVPCLLQPRVFSHKLSDQFLVRQLAVCLHCRHCRSPIGRNDLTNALLCLSVKYLLSERDGQSYPCPSWPSGNLFDLDVGHDLVLDHPAHVVVAEPLVGESVVLEVLVFEVVAGLVVNVEADPDLHGLTPDLSRLYPSAILPMVAQLCGRIVAA